MTKLLTSLLLLFLVLPCSGQDYSYDGNRWYEIEMSIFTNQPLNSQAKEHSFPSQVQLSYPDNIIELSAFTDSYLVDFEKEGIDKLKEEIDKLEENLNLSQGTLEPSLPSLGPEFNPASDTFRLKNPDSDSFIALGPKPRQFQRINRDIGSSNEHRLLYHAVWRQPVLNKVQASAIFINGGVRYGTHNELEGSITLSYNINRVDIDPLLWFNTFSGSQQNSVWSVPVQPFEQSQERNQSNTLQNYSIENVVLIDETRQMRSNEFHYLDHPDFGILIQIRPYQLPDTLDFNFEEED